MAHVRQRLLDDLGNVLDFARAARRLLDSLPPREQQTDAEKHEAPLLRNLLEAVRAAGIREDKIAKMFEARRR